MLRRSFLRLRFQAPPPKRGGALFDYERAINVTPGQMFSRDSILPSLIPEGSSDNNNPEEFSEKGPRRWIRAGDELCVARFEKSNSLLTSYEATYHFNDPQWNPILSLPASNPVSFELRARHINYGLRHLVQRGHAFYVVRHLDHSVFYPKGLAAISHVVCSLDEKNERLLTQIVHEGPVDAEDPEGRWDIIGTSDAKSLAQAFQRREMTWKRSRRVGSLQSQMGTYNWDLYDPREVGKNEDCEVMLLKSETVPYGSGLVCRGIVSSYQIARHPHHYVNQFEAPGQFAHEAFHQAMTLSCRHNGLLKDGEKLHVVAWKTRSFAPYSPIELDLPFDVHVTPPQVYRGDDLSVLPQPGVGKPYLREKELIAKDSEGKGKARKRLTLIQFDCALLQGASQYVYDDSAAARSTNWWKQKNALPYECSFYCIREGLLDTSELSDFALPFERLRSRLHAADAKKSGLRHIIADDQFDVDTSVMEDESLDIDVVKKSPTTLQKETREINGPSSVGTALAHDVEHRYDGVQLTKRRERMSQALRKMAKETYLKKQADEKRNPKLKDSPLPEFAAPSDKVVSRRKRSQKVLERIQKREREEAERKIPKKRLE